MAMRSRAEVDATLQTAKLKPAELLPAVQCLSFGPQAAAGECCLLQLEPGLCAELEAGRRYGRGAPWRPGGVVATRSAATFPPLPLVTLVVAGTATRGAG